MIAATVLVIFFAPLFFLIVKWFKAESVAKIDEKLKTSSADNASLTKTHLLNET